MTTPFFSSSRVREIPFERHFEENERDKGLKGLFREPENLSGILTWAIDDLKLMRSEGLECPQKVKEATKQYQEEADTVRQFINECLVQVVGHKVTIKDVYGEYEKWCRNNGSILYSSTLLTRDLRKKNLNIRVSTGNRTYLFDYALQGAEELLLEWQPEPV